MKTKHLFAAGLIVALILIAPWRRIDAALAHPALERNAVKRVAPPPPPPLRTVEKSNARNVQPNLGNKIYQKEEHKVLHPNLGNQIHKTGEKKIVRPNLGKQVHQTAEKKIVRPNLGNDIHNKYGSQVLSPPAPIVPVPNGGGPVLVPGPGMSMPYYPDPGTDIAPIVLPSADASVDAAAGQIVLPAGSTVPANISQIQTQVRNSAQCGFGFSVGTRWTHNQGTEHDSTIDMRIEARNLQPNHRYGVAIFSGDMPWARNPMQIGMIATDSHGYAYQQVEYVCKGCPSMESAVGLYELDGDTMIAGPLAMARVGKIGSPRCP